LIEYQIDGQPHSLNGDVVRRYDDGPRDVTLFVKDKIPNADGIRIEYLCKWAESKSNWVISSYDYHGMQKLIGPRDCRIYDFHDDKKGREIVLY